MPGATSHTRLGAQEGRSLLYLVCVFIYHGVVRASAGVVHLTLPPPPPPPPPLRSSSRSPYFYRRLLWLLLPLLPVLSLSPLPASPLRPSLPFLLLLINIFSPHCYVITVSHRYFRSGACTCTCLASGGRSALPLHRFFLPPPNPHSCRRTHLCAGVEVGQVEAGAFASGSTAALLGCAAACCCLCCIRCSCCICCSCCFSIYFLRCIDC